MIGFARFLFGRHDPKLWKVDDHRVKEIRMQVDTKRVWSGDPAWGGRRTKAAVYGTGYECVDCEKKFKSRDTFKDEECFEVIEHGA